MYEQRVNYTLLQNCAEQTHLSGISSEQNATVSSSSAEQDRKVINSAAKETIPLLQTAFKSGAQELRGQHFLPYDNRQQNGGYSPDLSHLNGIQANCPSTLALPLPRSPPNNHQSYKPMVSYRDHTLTERTDRCQPHTNISCKLVNRDLWLKFKDKTTEMIITKPGRRMFPVLLYKLDGLQPNVNYMVSLDMVQTSNIQWKFQNGQWNPSGQTDSYKPCDSGSHPHSDSPNSGAHFLKQEISFAKLKITNNKETAKHQIVLSSMHKYLPRLTVVPQHGLHEPQHFTFPETEFVAVTAYQNAHVTQLKIDKNPFAKGFRDNSRGGGKLHFSPGQHPNMPISKMAQPYYNQKGPSHTVPEAFKSPNGNHFSCQQHIPAESRSPDCVTQYQPNGIQDYYPPLPAANAFSTDYQHQVNQQPIQSYNGMHYANWYPSTGMYQKYIPCPPPPLPHEQPPKNWSRNDEDITRLQQTENQTESKQNWTQWKPNRESEKCAANDNLIQRFDQCRKRAHSCDLDNGANDESPCVKLFCDDPLCFDHTDNAESEEESVSPGESSSD